MRIVVAVACLLVFAPGCFVLDELDKGEAIMDAHSPKRRAEKEAKAKATAQASAKPSGAQEGEGFVERIQGWVEERKRASEIANRPKPDPDDVPIRCRVAGRTQFLRKSDCRLRGGEIL